MFSSYLAGVVHRMADDGWLDPPHSTTEASAELSKRVHRDARTKVHGAKAALLRVDGEGFRRFLKQYSKYERQSFWVKHNGDPLSKRRSLPKRQAVAIRRDDGTPTGTFQRPLMWAMSWEEWENSLSADVKLTEGMSVRIQFKRYVLALRTNYPAAMTPLQACELAGLDIDNLQFEAI